MLRALFLVLSLTLTGCVTQPVPLSGVPVSQLGMISNLPISASNVYMGVTVFENRSEEAQVPRDFSSAVIDEFKRQIEARGGELQDLSDRPKIEKQPGTWFETGYSLKFGLTPHKLNAETAEVLQHAMVEHNLDAILLLRPRQYDSDVPYGEAHPTGTFGIFKRVGPIHSFKLKAV